MSTEVGLQGILSYSSPWNLFLSAACEARAASPGAFALPGPWWVGPLEVPAAEGEGRSSSTRTLLSSS